MIFDVPASSPKIVPDVPTLAMVGEPEVQVPPGVASLKLVDDPAQTVAVPDIDAGKGFTVSTTEVKQPSGSR